jgi:hypothetical protein
MRRWKNEKEKTEKGQYKTKSKFNGNIIKCAIALFGRA